MRCQPPVCSVSVSSYLTLRLAALCLYLSYRYGVASLVITKRIPAIKVLWPVHVFSSGNPRDMKNLYDRVPAPAKGSERHGSYLLVNGDEVAGT